MAVSTLGVAAWLATAAASPDGFRWMTDDDEFEFGPKKAVQDLATDAVLAAFVFVFASVAAVAHGDGEGVLEWIAGNGPNPWRRFASKHGRLRLALVVASTRGVLRRRYRFERRDALFRFAAAAAALSVAAVGALRALAAYDDKSVFDARRLYGDGTTGTAAARLRRRLTTAEVFAVGNGTTGTAAARLRRRLTTAEVFAVVFGVVTAAGLLWYAAAEAKRRRAAAAAARGSVELGSRGSPAARDAPRAEYEDLIRSPDFFYDRDDPRPFPRRPRGDLATPTRLPRTPLSPALNPVHN